MDLMDLMDFLRKILPFGKPKMLQILKQMTVFLDFSLVVHDLDLGEKNMPQTLRFCCAGYD